MVEGFVQSKGEGRGMEKEESSIETRRRGIRSGWHFRTRKTSEMVLT